MLKKHRLISAGLSFFIFLTLLPEIAPAAIPDHWNERSFDLSALSGVAFGQNTFVSVGEGGTIFTSPDGFDWTPRTSGTIANLHRVNSNQKYLNGPVVKGMSI